MQNDIQSLWDIDTKEKIIKAKSNIFWLYQYSVRHFFNYSIDSNSFEYLLDICEEIINILICGSETLARKVLFAEDSVSRDKAIRYAMETLLVFYHNDVKSNIYSERFLHAQDYIPHTDYKSLILNLNEKQKKALKKIYSISYKYGFYVWDFLANVDIEEILKKCVEESDDWYNYFYISQFAHKGSSPYIDQEILKIRYLESSQGAGCLKPDSKYQITIYLDPTDKSISLNKIRNEIEIAINSCLRGKKDILLKFADPKRAKIKAQVNVKADKFKPRYVLHRVEHLIKAYNDFGKLTILLPSPSNIPSTGSDKDWNDGVELWSLTTSPPYEKHDPAKRAIGLWLWDRTRSQNPEMKLQHALQEIISRKLIPEFYPSRAKEDNIIRELKRHLKLTDECIREHTVKVGL